MRCPICSSELRPDATTCDECGCGILPPPPHGAEPTPFVGKESGPRWPLVLSVIGVVAALAVIAVALLPLFGDDDESIATGAATTDTTAVATTAAGTPDSSAGSAAPTTTVAVTTTSAAGSTTTTTARPASTTSVPASTTGAPATTTGTKSTTTTSTTPASTTTDAPATTSGALPALLDVSGVEATCVASASTDSRGNRITFDPAHVADDDPDTAWRCPGDAEHVALVLTLTSPGTVDFVGGIPGWLGEDRYTGADRWTQNRRVVLARWACLADDGSETASVEQLFDERRREPQYMAVDDFDGCTKVLFEILKSTRPGPRDYTALSELGLLS